MKSWDINTPTIHPKKEFAPVLMLVGKVREEHLLLGQLEDFSYNQKAVKQVRTTLEKHEAGPSKTQRQL